MSASEKRSLRAVIYRSAGLWVGQCLEADAAAQGDSVDEARASLQRTLEGNELHAGGLAGFPAAPKACAARWESAHESLDAIEGTGWRCELRVDRPTKLGDMDPGDVALRAVRMAQEHVMRLLMYLGAPAGAEMATQSSSLYDAMHALARWAILGEGEESYLHDSYLTALECLDSRALDPAVTHIDLGEAAEREPASDVELVLVAALARTQLAGGSSISTRQLAVLAGLTPEAVRKLRERGELPEGDGSHRGYQARTVRRFLASRGVVGFRARTVEVDEMDPPAAGERLRAPAKKRQ